MSSFIAPGEYQQHCSHLPPLFLVQVIGDRELDIERPSSDPRLTLLHRFNGMEENIHKLLSDSPETVKQLKPFLGKFDEEWEYIGYWRDTGVENLWIMPGIARNGSIDSLFSC